MTKEEIIKIIKLASSRDMIQETMFEISKEFTHYDYDLHKTVQDGAPEGYFTERIAEKVYNQLYKHIDENKLDELAENYCISEFAMTHEESTESAIAYDAYQTGYRKAKEE